MALFEDSFDTLNPKWIVTGNHTNFAVKAEDSFLKFIFGLEEVYTGAKWAGVYYADPFDLRNKKVTVKVDMVPKSPTIEIPVKMYEAGLMLANKTMPVGVGLFNDPDLMAVVFSMRYLGFFPWSVGGLLIKGYSYYGPVSGYLVTYPPTELSAEISGNTVKFLESNVPVVTFTLPFDPSKTYVYLLSPLVTRHTTPLPTQIDYDYIRIENLPPAPMPAIMGQTTAVMFATMLIMADASLIIRGLRLIK